MIFEVVEIAVQPQHEAQFEAALAKGKSILLRANGCCSVSLLRGVESPARYLLQIAWDSVEAHVAFAQSDAIAPFRALIAPHFSGPPRMEHFGTVL